MTTNRVFPAPAEMNRNAAKMSTTEAPMIGLLKLIAQLIVAYLLGLAVIPTIIGLVVIWAELKG